MDNYFTTIFTVHLLTLNNNYLFTKNKCMALRNIAKTITVFSGYLDLVSFKKTVS